MIKNRLKILLAERGLNLSELAKLADVHYTTMRRFAGDESESIHKVTLERVCHALNVQPGDIFIYQPDENRGHGAASAPDFFLN